MMKAIMPSRLHPATPSQSAAARHQQQQARGCASCGRTPPMLHHSWNAAFYNKLASKHEYPLPVCRWVALLPSGGAAVATNWLRMLTSTWCKRPTEQLRYRLYLNLSSASVLACERSWLTLTVAVFMQDLIITLPTLPAPLAVMLITSTDPADSLDNPGFLDRSKTWPCTSTTLPACLPGNATLLMTRGLQDLLV